MPSGSSRHPTSNAFAWWTAEHALVAVGDPPVGLGIVVRDRVISCAADIVVRAAIEIEGGIVVPVRAEDDRRHRGARGAVLALDHSAALAAIGQAAWLSEDTAYLLDGLLAERLAAPLARLPRCGEVGLNVWTPSGAWQHLYGQIADEPDIVVTAVPTNADTAAVVGCWIGNVVFTDKTEFVGFLGRDRQRRGQLVVQRADALIDASVFRSRS